MGLVHECCAGIDIGKADCKVCIRVPGRNGRRHTEIRTFSTMTEGLLALREWLLSEQITPGAAANGGHAASASSLRTTSVTNRRTGTC